MNNLNSPSPISEPKDLIDGEIDILENAKLKLKNYFTKYAAISNVIIAIIVFITSLNLISSNFMEGLNKYSYFSVPLKTFTIIGYSFGLFYVLFELDKSFKRIAIYSICWFLSIFYNVISSFCFLIFLLIIGLDDTYFPIILALFAHSILMIYISFITFNRSRRIRENDNIPRNYWTFTGGKY